MPQKKKKGNLHSYIEIKDSPPAGRALNIQSGVNCAKSNYTKITEKAQRITEKI